MIAFPTYVLLDVTLILVHLLLCVCTYITYTAGTNAIPYAKNTTYFYVQV
jgi:hypothetical protein